jgi:hypothetical protein
MHMVKSNPGTLGTLSAGSLLTAVSMGLAQTVILSAETEESVFDLSAVDAAESQMMKAVIADIEFISEYSSLGYAGQALPEVTVVTENELQLRYHSPEALVRAMEEGRPASRVSAFYDREANKIFLTDMNATQGPALFHEVVHYLQDINGKDELFADHMVCLEAEAYDLQAFWQTQKKIDVALKPDYGFVMTLQGACNDASFSWVPGNDPHTE